MASCWGLTRDWTARVIWQPLKLTFEIITTRSLPPLISRWLISHGFPSELAACLVRLHCLPSIEFFYAYGSRNFTVGPCALGCFMGSRSAGVLGRVPMLQTLACVTHAVEHYGLIIEGMTMTCSSFVDKVFSFAGKASCAIEVCVASERHLQATWQLSIKPSSHEVMAAKGSPTAPTAESLAPRWVLVEHLKSLGR